MNATWAVRMAIADARTLARLRSRHGLEVCLQEDTIWLRGRDSDEELAKKLRSLPGERFAVLPDGQLVPDGCRVPKGHLPESPWASLSQTVSVEIETPALGAESRDRVAVRLVRGGETREANLLLTTLDTWTTYAETAPLVRLEPLAFAVNGVGDVLVRGVPLPPLPGVRLVEEKGIAVPCGWTWEPAVDADVLRNLFN